MSATIESSGEIEIMCFPSGGIVRYSVVFEAFAVGDRLSLVFRPIDNPSPPYQLKILSPSGATIIDNMIRDLPTGMPQSPPAIEFVASAKGTYRIEIREMRGRARGDATVRVA